MKFDFSPAKHSLCFVQKELTHSCASSRFCLSSNCSFVSLSGLYRRIGRIFESLSGGPKSYEMKSLFCNGNLFCQFYLCNRRWFHLHSASSYIPELSEVFEMRIAVVGYFGNILNLKIVDFSSFLLWFGLENMLKDIQEKIYILCSTTEIVISCLKMKFTFILPQAPQLCDDKKIT